MTKEQRLLSEARDLLLKDGWVQNEYQCVWSGARCLGKAIEDASAHYPYYVQDRAHKLLPKELERWNDLPTTKFKDVIELLDEVINRG